MALWLNGNNKWSDILLYVGLKLLSWRVCSDKSLSGKLLRKFECLSSYSISWSLRWCQRAVFDSTTPHTLSLHFYFSFLTLTNIYLIRNKSHTCVSFKPRLEIKKQFDLTIKKLNTVSHSRQKVQQSRTTENNNNVNIFQECWNFIQLPNIWNLLSMPSFGLCYNYHY